MQKCRGLFAPDIGSIRSSSYMMSSKVLTKKGRPCENLDWKTCMIPLFVVWYWCCIKTMFVSMKTILWALNRLLVYIWYFWMFFFSPSWTLHLNRLKNLCRNCFVSVFCFFLLLFQLTPLFVKYNAFALQYEYRWYENTQKLISTYKSATHPMLSSYKSWENENRFTSLLFQLLENFILIGLQGFQFISKYWRSLHFRWVRMFLFFHL